MGSITMSDGSQSMFETTFVCFVLGISIFILFLYILIFLGSCDVYTVCVHSWLVVAPNFNSPHPQASRNWEESLGIKNEPAQNGQSRAGRLSRRKKQNMEKGQSWKIIVFSLYFFSVGVGGEQEWSVKSRSPSHFVCPNHRSWKSMDSK